MKFVISLLSICILSGAAYAQADDTGLKIVDVTPSAIYTPMGFGENNVAQIGVEGEFPTGCYRLLEIQHKVKKNKIYVKAKALKFEGPCLQVVSPWFRLHDVDILTEGSYEVRKNDASKSLMATLPVKHSEQKARMDEFEYAPIDGMQIEYDLDKLPRLVINGYLSNSCLELKDENVDVLVTSDRTIEVLPKLTYTEKENCVTGRYPFRRVYTLPKLENLPAKYMIYARVRGNTGIAKLETIFN